MTSQQDPTKPWTPPSDAILVEESTWTPPSDAIVVEPSPEKKSPSGSPSQGGLQGSQDGITAPSGGIEVPDRPLTGQLASLPPIGSLIDIDPSRPVPLSDPRKLSQEIEKAALSQAGLKPDDFRKKANDAVRQKELGEVEMEMYVVDGKAIPAERFKDLIFDQKFIDETQKGLHNVQINPGKNEYVSQFLDKDLVDAASRNLQSGTRTGDKWESFMSGAARAASGVAGMETMYYDVVEEVLGIPLRRDLFGVAELQETSEELAKKSEEYQKKTFQYRENFLNSVLEGKWSDAAQQAGDATAASVPYSAGAAALTYAGGPALAFSVLAPMSSSAEYASMKVSEDQAFMQLSRAEKLLRSNVVGPLEAATDIVAGRAVSRSFDLTKSLYKGLVKEVAEKQGLDAADKAAKELSKNVIRKYGENIGLQMTEEFFAEGGSTAGTMLYDDLMGIRSYDAKDYISEILNSGLLGAASGGITTGVLGGPTAIYATGLTATNKLKSVFDKKLYEDPSAVENLSKRVDSMKVPNEVKEDLKENLAKREKAVKAVPKDKVSDTETVDTVQEIQELEEQKKGLLPVWQEPIQAEIDAKTEKLKEGIGKDKPRSRKEWGTDEGNEALSDAARRDFLYVTPLEQVDGKMQLKKNVSSRPTVEKADRLRASATMDSIIERGIKNGLSAEDIIGELADRGFRVGGARSNMRPKEYVQARIDGKSVPTLREIFGYDRLTDASVVYETDTERRETPVEDVTAETTPTETVEQTEEVAPAEVAVEGVQEGVVEVKSFKKGEGGTAGVLEGKDGKLYKSAVPNRRDIINGKVEIVPVEGKETQEHKFLSENQDMKHLPKVGKVVETSQGKAFEIEKLNEVEKGSLTLDEINQIQETLTELNNRGVEVADNNTVMRRDNGDIVLIDLSNAQERNKNDIGETVSSNVVELLSKNDQTRYLANEQSKQIIEELTLFDEAPKPKTEFTYLLTQRPPSIGTHPIGQTRDAEEITLEDGKRKAYKITYDKPLSPEEIKQYELTEDVTMNDVGRVFEKTSGRTLISKLITNVSDKGVSVTTFLGGKAKSETMSRRKFQREIDGYSETSQSNKQTPTETVEQTEEAAPAEVAVEGVQEETEEQKQVREYAEWKEKLPPKIEALKKMPAEDVVSDIVSRPLIHAGGLGMESTEGIGTYISTETRGNRYAKNAKKIYKADVTIKNPIVKGGGLVYEVHSKERIQKALDEMLEKGDIDSSTREELRSVDSIDDENLDLLGPNLSKMSKVVASIFTNELIDQGYDSIYIPESETREGYIIVFDKGNVKLTEIANQDEAVKSAAINRPSQPTSPAETVEQAEEVAPAEEQAPSMPDQLPMTKLTEDGEYDMDDPFTYQQLKGERLIQRSETENGVAKWDDNSLLVRERIENAGDILRELSLRGPSSDRNYLYEKVNKLKGYFDKLKGRDLLADDRPFGAMNRNEELFRKLRQAWYNQPTSDDAQAAVRRLVLELADGNSDGASLNRVLDNVVAEIEKIVPIRQENVTAEAVQPTPPTDAVQEQSTESVPVRQQPEARQGVREEDTQGQETPQEGEAVKGEVTAENLLPDFKAIPMSSVTTDEARFQGRESLDEENVQKIIDEFDERKLDPIVAWRDPETNALTVLSGHHRYEAAKRMGRKDIPVREFIGNEQEAIDFARDSNVMGKQETPVERAGRYRQMREQGISEAEIQRRARSAHGKDASFMVNISRLDPKGKAMDAMRQFNESTDKSTRSRIEAIADWIGALKKTHPDVSKAQESEMFDHLLEVYSPKSQRGKISTRNQFVDVASAVIERMKNNGTFNEDAVLNLANVAGKGALEMEYDAKLEEAKQRESDARKAIETRRAELVMIGTDPKKNEKKLTPSQIDRALVPYEDALRIAIREVGEIRATKETAIAGDRAQISLFDEIAEPTTPTDEITERRIEGILEEGREQTQAPKRDTGRGQAKSKPSKPKIEPTEKTDTQKLLEEKMAERERKRKEIEDRIKQTKGDIWDDLNKLGIATDPEQQAAETKKMQDHLISIAKDYISLGMMNVEDFIASLIENYKGKRTDMAELAEAAFKKAKSEQEPSGKRSSEKGSGKQSQKRYTTRVIRNLEKLADKKELLEAIRETGEKGDVVSWKSVRPLALEMVEDIFSDPKDINDKMDFMYKKILKTDNEAYLNNPSLSTLHSLLYHVAIDRLANEGMKDDYKKWVVAFQGIGRSNGQFNSAMQEAASSYAVKNLVVRPVFDADIEKLNEKAEDGETRAKHVEDVKELYDAILQSDELIDLLQKRVGELEGQVEYYRDTQRPEASQPLDRKRQLKKEKDEALQMIRRGLAKARGQANVGMPLNEDLINGTIALAKYYVKVGIYKAADLKKMVMNEVVNPSKDNPDTILQVADAIDSYLASDEFKDSRKESMKAAFVDALESRAKAMMGNERATRKSAEQVLLDSLLSKLASDIGKDAKKGSKAYEQRLREALENADFSDSVWKAAMENVRIWMDMQDMAPTTRAEILSRLEDTASAFMEKPFAKSDIRKAIREGEKDLGTSLADVVKRHFTEQNSTLKTLAEKLVSELGLSAETAKKYEQAIIEEARSYMNDKRMSAIQKALGVDSAGMPKEKAKKVNKAIVDRMIEGVNLGMLDDDLFRGMFAEKYGLIDLTPEMVANINRFNDLIHLHEGTDVSRRYKKELMDYIETLKPWNVAAFAKLTQGLVIKNMLNGLATFLNISAGSMYSFFTGIGPSMLMNIPATKAFFDEYSKAGLSSSSRRMFKDIMIDGRSPIDEGLGGKFDDGEVTGDRFEYFVKEYDVKKLRETFANAKTPKEVGTATLIAAARAFSLISQLSNFAKAFDVLLSNRGTEFEMFLKYYNEMSKEAGRPLRARFDPSVSKQFIDRLREKMAYDPDARAEMEASVDEQIAGMKARGEKVGAATRQVLIREGMVARRDMKEYRQAMDRVRSYLLMEDPNGLLGQIYDTQRGWGTIKGDEGAAKALAKLGYSLTFGLFLRISITATQRSIENIPVAGLLAPGFLYDYTRTDPSDPRSPKKWMGMFERKGGELVKNEMYDHKAMKRRLAVHAMIAGLTVAAGWNMFVLKDVEDEEEDEEGNIKTVKKTRLDINPDRVIEFTAHSGEFFKAEQFSGLDTQGGIDRRRDYYFRVKVGGKWENVAPARLNPYFLFPTAVLGGIADDITLGMSKNERKRDAILNTWDDLAMGLAEFSFAGNAKLIRNTIYATQRGGVLEGAAEVGEFVLKPARVAIYPNALRDVYKEMRAIQGQEEKYGEGMLGALSNDIPVLEDMVGISSYDIFGYPKKVTSKFIQVGTDIPVAGIFIDNVIDHKYRNEERFDTDAWKLKMTYFPDVEIQGYWPKNTKNVTVTREMKNEASKVYGEFMRSAIEATPKDAWETLSQGDIDRAINGRMMSDGSRKGSGIHHAAVEVAKASIGISEMGKLTEIENSVRTELKEVREKSVQTEADEAMKSYLVDALQTISDVRKQLEQKTKK